MKREKFTQAFNEWSYVHQIHKQLDKYHITLLKSEDKDLETLTNMLSHCITELEKVAKKRFKKVDKIRKEIQNEKNN